LQVSGVKKKPDDEPADSKAASEAEPVVKIDGPSVNVSAGDESLELLAGPTHLASRRTSEGRWPETGEPVASVYSLGRGEVWLVHRPEFMLNERVRDGDNAVVLCRLAEAFGKGERIYFDEFFHGIRERPGIMEMLWEPPMRWATLQGFALLALVLWRYLPRFGAVVELPPSRRRSKEEYVDALANLLEQKRAYPEAVGVVQTTLAREFEHDLALSPGAPTHRIAEYVSARRPNLDSTRVSRALGDAPPERGGFLIALNELENIRREYFDERNNR
jgi:hypothetical protein